MRGSKKSKRLSWAPDLNLCQIRLFLSEESPSQVGLGTQDHLQAKTSWMSHPTGTANDDILPPGFEGGHATNQVHVKVPEIPVIKWSCPPRVILNISWQVVSGEESKEVEIQNQREMRVLEAVYPRPSAIPPNPTFPMDANSLQNSDHQAPLIPITPIEDEDAADTPSDKVPVNSQAQLLAPGISSLQCSTPSIRSTSIIEEPTTGQRLGIEPNTVAAAVAAINKSNENGTLIDPDLLIKILSNPTLIAKWVTDHGPTSSAQNMPKPTASFAPVSEPTLPPVTLQDPSHVRMSRAESSTLSVAVTSSGQFYSQPVGMGIHSNVRVPPQGVPAPPPPPPPPSVSVPQTKDVNYYKSLIQQHGGERQDTTQQFGGRYNHQLGPNQEINPRSRETKHKIMKPCIYYNSSRGCRNGANCAYQHDASSQQRASSISEVQSAKRMKMDREISS